MDDERVTHPELVMHKHFLQNLDLLKENIKTSKAEKNDMYYNFFIQFIQATTDDVNDVFKNIIKEAVYNDFSQVDPRTMAAHIIKRNCIGWPEQFISSTVPRIYLSDIRNQVVFVLWSQHRHMIDSLWMPDSNPEGTEAQNIDYKRAAHALGSRMLDPKDSERLCTFFSWVHFLKMIHFVKKHMDDSGDLPVHILNTCSGSWLYTYNKNGLAKLIWELYLDVWHFDNC